jgi:hypothetical protein
MMSKKIWERDEFKARYRYDKNKDWSGEHNLLHWRMVNCIKLAKTIDYDDVWQQQKHKWWWKNYMKDH